MKVALVFPPYTHKIFSENLPTVDEEFCLAPPIILAYVAAIMESHGHQVKLIDARALNLSRERVLKELRKFSPDMLGFRAESYHFHDALDWIGYFKRHLRVPVVAGGINLTLYPRETLSHPEIDYAIIGEAIESLPRLLGALENGKDPQDIPGIGYKKNGAVMVNPPEKKLIDFDAYPFPARHLLPNEAYYSFISQVRNFTVMLTSTGCPFRCSFCAIHPNTVYRTRSAQSVIDEIELCHREFGVREIDFFDAVFFLNKPRMLEIFALMRKKRLKVQWSCRSRVDTVDAELLREASAAGCRQIYYGVESVNHEVLNAIRKDVDTDRIKETIKMTKDYGIRALGFFMVGNPRDNRDSVNSTIDFAKSLDLDYIQVCRTIAKPGTELDKVMIEKTGKDYWRQHISGSKIECRLPAPWVSLSEEEIERLTKDFYLKFYFRPRVIFSRLSQLRSFNELKRYVKVGLRLLMERSELYSHILTDTSNAQKILAQSGAYLSEARKLKTAIVIPTYNEKGNIANIISAIAGVLPEADVVVVDDNSPDGTAMIVKKLAQENRKIHLIERSGKRGLGFAYIDGFNYVLGRLDSEFIFEMDADLSHNPHYLPVFLHYANEYDLVTGSRFLGTVSIKDRALWRNLISKLTKWIVNIFIGLDLTDVTTGFKCYKRDIIKKINLDRIQSSGFAFQIENSYYVKDCGGRIKEVPILFIERSIGKSKMSARIMLEAVYLICRLALLRARKIFRGP